jgi:hypothetical protein
MVVKPKEEKPAQGDFVESLDDIAKISAVADAEPGAQTPAVQTTTPSEAKEISAALSLVRAAAVVFAPDHVQQPLLLVWSDSQLEQIAAALVEVCKKHGWTVGDLFGTYGPYIQLAMAAGLPALATLKILKTPAPVPATDGQQQPA